MTGFVIFDYQERYAEGLRQLSQWLAGGELKSHEQVERGTVADFPATLLKLFSGQNSGKLVLALTDG
jgi:NADPH-dependent curcumin reductase CurA